VQSWPGHYRLAIDQRCERLTTCVHAKRARFKHIVWTHMTCSVWLACSNIPYFIVKIYNKCTILSSSAETQLRSDDKFSYKYVRWWLLVVMVKNIKSCQQKLKILQKIKVAQILGTDCCMLILSCVGTARYCWSSVCVHTASVTVTYKGTAFTFWV